MSQTTCFTIVWGPPLNSGVEVRSLNEGGMGCEGLMNVVSASGNGSCNGDASCVHYLNSSPHRDGRRQASHQ